MLCGVTGGPNYLPSPSLHSPLSLPTLESHFTSTACITSTRLRRSPNEAVSAPAGLDSVQLRLAGRQRRDFSHQNLPQFQNMKEIIKGPIVQHSSDVCFSSRNPACIWNRKIKKNKNYQKGWKEWQNIHYLSSDLKKFPYVWYFQILIFMPNTNNDVKSAMDDKKEA